MFSRTPEEHVKYTEMVLRLLKNTGVTPKFNNGPFFTNRTNYIGHIIRSGRPKVTNHTTDEIRELKRLTTVTELRCFL